VEVLIAAASSPRELSADAAAERVVGLGAGRLSFELLLPIDAVQHSEALKYAQPGVGGLETIGWVLMGLLVSGGITVVWGLRSATCCRSARWAYAHGVLQEAPIGEDDDPPRLSSFGKRATAPSLGLYDTPEPDEAHISAQMAWREGAPGSEEARLMGDSLLSPGAEGPRPASGKEPFDRASCRGTTY
jgi:hypothetical protein